MYKISEGFGWVDNLLPQLRQQPARRDVRNILEAARQAVQGTSVLEFSQC